MYALAPGAISPGDPLDADSRYDSKLHRKLGDKPGRLGADTATVEPMPAEPRNGSGLAGGAAAPLEFKDNG